VKDGKCKRSYTDSFKNRSIKSVFNVCAVIVRFSYPTPGYNTSYTQSVDIYPSQGIYRGIGAAVVGLFRNYVLLNSPHLLRFYALTCKLKTEQDTAAVAISSQLCLFPCPLPL
jgi:hypothetical protein